MGWRGYGCGWLDWLFKTSYGRFCFFVMLPIFILGMVVELIFGNIHRKYSKVESSRGLSGAVVARNILDEYGLNNVRVEQIGGRFVDRFNPRTNIVGLSSGNYNGTSVAAIGVAAHEVGHAIQHAKGYFPAKVRLASIPVVNICSRAWFWIYLVGLFISSFHVMALGIVVFSCVALFELITLRVEFDASFRALKIIKSKNLLQGKEVSGVRKILFIAAMTYLVSLLMSVAEVIRFVLELKSRTGRYRDD